MGIEVGIPFGNYTLVKRIARGGMAEVFVAKQAKDDGSDGLIAIKRILPHLLADQSFVRMFQEEATLAAQLSHPNIIHIYDHGKVEDDFFIAMEYAPGVHTGDLIRYAEKQAIPPALVARIGAHACAGLHYAHTYKDKEGQLLKLVHRDMSPPNLLVSYKGQVKIVDFGIAKAVSSIEKTRPGVVKGKYAFMSPEQTMGKKLDGRSDVFSLALVLWELLAGQSAVRRDDQVEAMKALRDGNIPPIESVRPDTPSALARALRHALRTNVRQRSTAKQLGKALETFLQSLQKNTSSKELGRWLRHAIPPDEKAPLRTQPPLELATHPALSIPSTDTPLPSVSGVQHSPISHHVHQVTPEQDTVVVRSPFDSLGSVAQDQSLTTSLIPSLEAREKTSDKNEGASPPTLTVDMPLKEQQALSLAGPTHGGGVNVQASKLRGFTWLWFILLLSLVTGLLIAFALLFQQKGLPQIDQAKKTAPLPHTISVTPKDTPEAAPSLPLIITSLPPDSTNVKISTPNKLRPAKEGPLSSTQRIKRAHRKQGRLSIQSAAPGTVYLGGQKLGQLPLYNKSISVGRHLLTIKRPGQEALSKRVIISKGRTTRIKIE